VLQCVADLQEELCVAVCLLLKLGPDGKLHLPAVLRRLLLVFQPLRPATASQDMLTNQVWIERALK